MQAFTEGRTLDTPDQLWLVEHSPVYTLGQAGKPEHLLNPGQIPVVKSDRGGQVTYHGPGQVVVYVLADLKRTGLTIRAMVQALEEAVIGTLADYGLSDACRKPGAPGVYLPQDGDLAKIAALGIKVRKGCTYHGVALNVDMDLSPFDGINPCGYEGLKTISMASEGVAADWDEVAVSLAGKIINQARLRVE
ncbi:MAG: lipoyl(octanoyl) transferase LipB [Burkholderiaceae bacterium]|nr:lipoyl(octanoyl) transferase LipB [Burkholderiaceae bacterium]MCD8517909.1 lipoyl(octanoyl) transferase LipB [Burkholderiaceae bacterium]MCD8565352.1 lipoyl(octanoyl) transferase LipB [Burkholderiaceae bacterium]